MAIARATVLDMGACLEWKTKPDFIPLCFPQVVALTPATGDSSERKPTILPSRTAIPIRNGMGGVFNGCRWGEAAPLEVCQPVQQVDVTCSKWNGDSRIRRLRHQYGYDCRLQF